MNKIGGARISGVWDSTTDVLAGRAGLLLPIAALAFLLPSAVQAGIGAYAGKSVGVSALNVAMALVALIATVWGQLAVIAVASNPATTRAEAGAAATRRLPAGLLVTVVLVAALIAALLPVVLVLAASGFDFQAAARAGSASAPSIGFGAAMFCFFYGLALVALALWLSARLFLTNAVVLNERRGIGALGRSIGLTRGLTLKLIGVLILFVIVLMVASWAAQSVLFVVVRLLLGSAHIATATFVGAVATAVLSAAFSTVVAVFGARLYAAVSAEPGVAPSR